MADDMKAATLRPAHDSELLALVETAITSVHTTLGGATIRLFWALAKPANFWGRIEVATEKLWWVSGALENEGADIILQINETLWEKLTTAGRKFLVDHFLDQVHRKEGGLTEMETEEGARLLYEKKEGTLKINPRVIARHPKGLREIEELRKVWMAMVKPTQYEIEFPSDGGGEEREDDVDGGDSVDSDEPKPKKRAAPREVVPPIYYYGRHMLPDHGPTAVRYTAADRKPETVEGVYFFPDVNAANACEDLAGLTYETAKADIKSVRDELEMMHLEWTSSADRAPLMEEPAAAGAVAH